MKILSEVKSTVRIESSLARDTARAVLNLAVFPPARPGGVEVCRNVVRNVSDDELCFRNAVTNSEFALPKFSWTAI